MSHRFRKIRFGYVLKLIWIALCVLILKLGIVGNLADHSYSYVSNLLSCMVFLTFPSGILAASYWFYFFGHPSQPGGFTMMWGAMFFAGYLQWFILIPNLFRHEVIKLDLVADRPNIADAETQNPAPGPKPRRKVRRRMHIIRPFDAEGLSPFERVIKSSNTVSLTKGSGGEKLQSSTRR